MKIAGRERSNRPTWSLLRCMQLYSTRGWVYREGEGWVFAKLTSDELAELRSYEYGITIARMRVRLPYGYAVLTHNLDDYAYWFAHCSMPRAHPLLLNKFIIHQLPELIDEERVRCCFWDNVKPGSYETWLWNDEAKWCQELGCEVTTHGGHAWCEWGVPAEWKPPLPYLPYVEPRVFICNYTGRVAKAATLRA